MGYFQWSKGPVRRYSVHTVFGDDGIAEGLLRCGVTALQFCGGYPAGAGQAEPANSRLKDAGDIGPEVLALQPFGQGFLAGRRDQPVHTQTPTDIQHIHQLSGRNNHALLLLPKGEGEEIKDQDIFLDDAARIDGQTACQLHILFPIADTDNLDGVIRKGAVLLQRVPEIQETGLPPALFALGIVPKAQIINGVVG